MEPDIHEIAALLERSGVLDGEVTRALPLSGGVSSDVWRIDSCTRSVCVKRAIPKLRVAADWRVPISRGRFEVAWLELVAGFAPESVPAVLAADASRNYFVMEYLGPPAYVSWKAQLLEGEADPAFAREVGERVVAIHARTAGDEAVASAFPTDELFDALRLDPFIAYTAGVHEDLAPVLMGIYHETLATKRALAHGDVSPKNILRGPRGPVFLDAETAWYGDPAFDVAFCLNHLLLKCVWRGPARERYLACVQAWWEGYRGGVDWEPLAALERRAARLLPALSLARVDGKSPVEYLDEEGRRLVRETARGLLRAEHAHLETLIGAWRRVLA